ncbi:MAG: acyl-CoA dehydrogenase family protein, partial [Candidatus Binataceae bacterium]
MNYITDERKMIQQMARDFALEQVLPIANKLDPEQGEIPMSLRDKMAELGYFGILIPEEYGGLGLGAFEYALVTEELARAWMSVASIIARGNSLWGGVTEEDKRRYFPKIARGEWLGAFSLSEPDAGSDLANVACKATRAGDEWIINGTKTWCTFADGADYIVLFARTSPPTDPKRRHVGISQFLVQKERGTFPPGI